MKGAVLWSVLVKGDGAVRWEEEGARVQSSSQGLIRFSFMYEGKSI